MFVVKDSKTGESMGTFTDELEAMRYGSHLADADLKDEQSTVYEIVEQ